MNTALALKAINQIIKHASDFKSMKAFLGRYKDLKKFWPGARRVLTSKIENGARMRAGATLTQGQCKALNKFLQKSKKVFN